MKYSFFTLFLTSLILFSSCTSKNYDVIVYGGTASGVIAACSASRMGANVLLIGPDITIGGMTTGGLGQTDIGNKQAIKGLARQFYRKVGEHYGEFEKWTFEPHVAEEILEKYLQEEKNITTIRGAYLEKVVKDGKLIKSIVCSGKKYCGKQYIDCSYEGDLMAMAGVSYRTGREDNSEYNEDYDGSQLMNGHQFCDYIDPYVVPGDSSSGLLWGISKQTLKKSGTGDNLIQAYNYRICLTDDPNNKIEISKPENYDSTRYDLVIRILSKQSNKLSLSDWFIWSKMPNHKTDINNRGPFSTDMIGMNYDYPEGNWEVRDSIIKAHKDYTLGLLYFFGHDNRLPDTLRNAMLKWGLPKDEYISNGHWTHQLYIREARRMVGEYVATQADCQNRVHVDDGIAMAAYNMDSHNCERIIFRSDSCCMVKNEGNVEISGGVPYYISYRSITPKREECTNLLVPVCISATHIAFGSIRMEPVFMGTGQAAGIGAVLALNSPDNTVQNVSVAKIQQILREDPHLDGTKEDIIIDDNNNNAVKYTGWAKSSTFGSYGASVLTLSPDSLNATLTYSFPKEITGKYHLLAYQIEGSSYSQINSYELTNGEKSYSFSFDRSNFHAEGQTNGEWVELGTIELDGSFPAELKVRTVKDGKTGISDAILLKNFTCTIENN